jgi:hypothetical protein
LDCFKGDANKDQEFWKDFDADKIQFKSQKNTELGKLLIKEVQKILEISSAWSFKLLSTFFNKDPSHLARFNKINPSNLSQEDRHFI